MILTVFEVFIGGPLAGVDSGPLPVSFVCVHLLARVDAYVGLSSLWGCFAERGAMNLSIGVRAVIWLRIFCYTWSSACRLFGFRLFVSLSMWKLSMVFSILPFPVMWMTFIISSILPKACPSSIRCWANFGFLLLYLKSLMCSLNLVLNDFRSVLCTSSSSLCMLDGILRIFLI